MNSSKDIKNQRDKKLRICILLYNYNSLVKKSYLPCNIYYSVFSYDSIKLMFEV